MSNLAQLAEGVRCSITGRAAFTEDNMKYKAGVTIQVELVVEAKNEQDAIIEAMNKTEAAVSGMEIRRHWWEFVKEYDDETSLSGPAKL